VAFAKSYVSVRYPCYLAVKTFLIESMNVLPHLPNKSIQQSFSPVTN